jgi:hypothetical protein
MATVKLDPAKGIQIPNLTTTERNAISSPETGAIIWNTTTSEINQYNGSAWEITYTDTNTQIAGITSSADATAITIDSSENVGIGVTPAMASSSYNGLHIGATYPTMKLSSNSSGHAAADGFHLRIDSTPRVEYWNYENTDQVFSNNNSEKIRILAGGGITFNGDTAAANALDDYEEGTWTPTLIGSGGGTGTWASSTNTYTKVGRAVHFTAYLTATSLGSASNAVIIGGLPFTNASAGGYQAVATGAASGLAITAGTCVTAFIDVNSTRIYPRIWNATTGTAAYGFYVTELTADGQLMLSGTYFTT